MRETAVQQHMPRRRTGHTTSVTIGGERFYLTANGRQDDTLGEVFIQSGKQGTTGAGLMDTYAVALSVGLQHGMPLAELVRQGLDLYFVPSGHTDDPQIPRVRSVVDYAARRLAIDWLPYDQRAELGIFTLDERMTQAGRVIPQRECWSSSLPGRPSQRGWPSTGACSGSAPFLTELRRNSRSPGDRCSAEQQVRTA